MNYAKNMFQASYFYLKVSTEKISHEVKAIMKFGQLIEIKYLSKNHAEKKTGTVVQNPFIIFEKALYEVKARGLELSFNMYCQPLTWHTIKTNYSELQANDTHICSILIFQKKIWDQLTDQI